MFKNCFQNNTVLVTGHTGFKGSWLSIWLRELGAQVVGFSLEPPSDPSNFVATGLKSRIINLHGDIREIGQLTPAFREYQPEFVFHLAAQPLVRLSYDEPKLTFDTNLGGTINVLEAVRSSPSVKVLINITSDKCYENKEWTWGYRENDPMGGHDPYSASKGCAELAFAAYLRSFFTQNVSSGKRIGAASVRAGNVIGGGDWGKDRLLPDCIRALSSGQPIGIRNPRSIRPWQHVLEPLSGYLWLGALLKEDPFRYSGGWNLGPEDDSHITTVGLVERLIRYWGEGSWRDLSNKDAPHETKLLKLNCDKAHAELQWRSILNLDEGLRLSADWYKKYYDSGSMDDMYSVCADQIREYSSRASRKALAWTAG
jgi:CDP-glucose 4,6-dehydratase